MLIDEPAIDDNSGGTRIVMLNFLSHRFILTWGDYRRAITTITYVMLCTIPKISAKKDMYSEELSSL